MNITRINFTTAFKGKITLKNDEGQPFEVDAKNITAVDKWTNNSTMIYTNKKQGNFMFIVPNSVASMRDIILAYHVAKNSKLNMNFCDPE